MLVAEHQDRMVDEGRVQPNPQGGIDRRPAPMAISNVAVEDPKSPGTPTRVRFETKDGKKVRVAVKSGEVISG